MMFRFFATALFLRALPIVQQEWCGENSPHEQSGCRSIRPQTLSAYGVADPRIAEADVQGGPPG
jgi:hypothetical protein